MADFCKECSVKLFNKDFGDLKNLVTEREVELGFLAAALCEGCGYIFVNHLGERQINSEIMDKGGGN